MAVDIQIRVELASVLRVINDVDAASQGHRPSRGVESTVAQELFEHEAVALADRFELALEEEHLPVRVDLFLAPGAADVTQRFREIRDVIDQAEAMDHRIEHARAA